MDINTYNIRLMVTLHFYFHKQCHIKTEIYLKDYYYYYYYYYNRDGVFGIMPRLRAERSWVPIPVGARDLVFSKDVQTDPEAQYRASFTAVNQSGHEADHSSPCTAEVKNEWNYTSLSPIRPRSVDRDFRFKIFN